MAWFYYLNKKEEDHCGITNDLKDTLERGTFPSCL